MQRLQRVALVAELADVVVLDDPRADPGRPPEQGQPPLERHDDAAGELVAGRHVGQPRALRGRREPGRIEPARVHRHAQEAGAHRLEGNGRARVVRLLHHRAVARIEQDARDQVQCLLRPVHDHDSLGVAHDAPRPTEILAERRAQGAVAGGRAVAERVGGRAARVSGEEPAPDLARELVHRGPPVAEVVAKPWPRARRARGREVEPLGEAPRVGGHRRGTLRRGTTGRRGPARRRHARHGGRAAVAAHQVALGGELLVRQHHGVARHAEVPRQRARGRDPGGRAEAAGTDLGLERQVDPAIERFAHLPQVQQHGAPLGARPIWPL
jgi:hypothetical protein